MARPLASLELGKGGVLEEIYETELCAEQINHIFWLFDSDTLRIIIGLGVLRAELCQDNMYGPFVQMHDPFLRPWSLWAWELGQYLSQVNSHYGTYVTSTHQLIIYCRIQLAWEPHRAVRLAQCHKKAEQDAMRMAVWLLADIDGSDECLMVILHLLIWWRDVSGC